MLVTQGLQLATGQLALFFQAWKFFGPSPVLLAQALESTPPLSSTVGSNFSSPLHPHVLKGFEWEGSLESCCMDSNQCP